MSDPGPPFPPPGPPPPPSPHATPPPPGPAPAPAEQPAPQGGWAPYGAAAAGQQTPARTPELVGAWHRPGAVPLRPLGLGAIYDGAFRIIRYNPRATVGAAALVTGIAMLIPVLANLVVTFTAGIDFDPMTTEGSAEITTSQAIGLLAGVATFLFGLLAAQLGLIFVTGMIAHVTRAAAIGRRMSLGEAWAATHGKRWRLIGLTLLIGLLWMALLAVTVGVVVAVGLVTGDPLLTVLAGVAMVVVLLCTGAWLWIKVTYLASAALMLEDGGVFAALGRTWRLSGGHFWRTLGIALLTVLITGIAAQIIGTPIGLIGNLVTLVAPEHFLAILVLTQAISSVITNAFVAPFNAAVSSLQYLDLRIRKEGHDVELMREAGIIPR